MEHIAEGYPEPGELYLQPTKYFDFDKPIVRDFADEAIIRHGIGAHRQIGWSAADIQTGLNQQPRARRADGAVALS